MPSSINDLNHKTFVCFSCFRYITALTDSEEEEDDDVGHKVQEPVDELAVLLQRADELHKSNGAEKKEGLTALMEKKQEVNLTKIVFYI